MQTNQRVSSNLQPVTDALTIIARSFFMMITIERLRCVVNLIEAAMLEMLMYWTGKQGPSVQFTGFLNAVSQLKVFSFVCS